MLMISPGQLLKKFVMPINRVVAARLLCATDPLAPNPDAPIQWGKKTCKAWEARQPMADALIEYVINSLMNPTEEALIAICELDCTREECSRYMVCCRDKERMAHAKDILWESLSAEKYYFLGDKNRDEERKND